jgi:hypothetical protein
MARQRSEGAVVPGTDHSYLSLIYVAYWFLRARLDLDILKAEMDEFFPSLPDLIPFTIALSAGFGLLAYLADKPFWFAIVFGLFKCLAIYGHKARVRLVSEGFEKADSKEKTSPGMEAIRTFYLQKPWIQAVDLAPLSLVLIGLAMASLYRWSAVAGVDLALSVSYGLLIAALVGQEIPVHLWRHPYAKVVS